MTIITSHPMAVVAFTSCGAIFFNGLGAILGDNRLGSTRKTIGWTLNLPMKRIEVLLNRIVLFTITAVTGFPLLLNATAEQNFRSCSQKIRQETSFMDSKETKYKVIN
jgi:hypothetical protein